MVINVFQANKALVDEFVYCVQMSQRRVHLDLTGVFRCRTQCLLCHYPCRLTTRFALL